MKDEHFDERMSELLEKINDLPSEQKIRLEQLATETRARRERIQASVTELQESIDYLRLSVKYLVFDLEATRRENAYLRRLLEETSRDLNEADGDADDDLDHDHDDV